MSPGALILLALASSAMAAEPLPLLSHARQVACSQDPQEVRSAALRLRGANARALGFPDEQLSASGDGDGLRASVLDVLLAALAQGARNHPELAPALQALVDSWNPCAVVDAEGAYDVERVEGAPRRYRLMLPMPLGGAGLRAWKLLPALGEGAAAPTEQDAAPFLDLCAASSGGGALFDFTPGLPSGPLPVVPPAPAVPAACLPPLSAPVAPAPVAPAPRSPPSPRRLPVEEVPPGPIPHPPPGVSSAAAPLVVAPGPRHWSTGVSFSQGLEGSGTLAAFGAFAPVRGLSARVGAAFGLLRDFRLAREAHRLTLSWAVGYDGGGAGTWSLQLNNWGPVEPRAPETLLRGSALELGYTPRLPRLLAGLLSPHLKLSLPLERSPSFSTGLTLRPARGLFASVSLRFAPLDRTALTWSYVAGYSVSWRHQTFSVSYTHWGAAPAFELELVKGGALTAGVSWAL